MRVSFPRFGFFLGLILTPLLIVSLSLFLLVLTLTSLFIGLVQIVVAVFTRVAALALYLCLTVAPPGQQTVGLVRVTVTPSPKQ